MSPRIYVDGRTATVAFLGAVLAVASGIVAFAPLEKAEAVNNLNFFGTAQEVDDPTGGDPSGDGKVIFISTLAPGTFGGLRSEVKDNIDSLDGKLQFNYFLLGMDCSGGSPRVQLAIDTDGDGTSDGNAFGYVGPSPSFTGCTQKSWQFEDLTDGELQWDLTQFGGAFYNTWAGAKSFINTEFPDHTVLRATIVADEFSPNMQGFSYYDNIVLGGGTS